MRFPTYTNVFWGQLRQTIRKSEPGRHAKSLGGGGVCNPQTLIRTDLNCRIKICITVAGDKIVPDIQGNEVQIREPQLLVFCREVVHREDTLFTILALPPEREESLSQLKSKLSCVGVECSLTTPDLQTTCQFAEPLAF